MDGSLAQGWSIEENVMYLFLWPDTVWNYVSSILNKLGAADRMQDAGSPPRHG
jgi:DNA-binding NarL/FixJ family response regulator